MEDKVPRKPYIVSEEFRANRKHIYNYTLNTFGYFQAERYMQKIRESLFSLPEYYTIYPECRHLATIGLLRSSQ